MTTNSLQKFIVQSICALHLCLCASLVPANATDSDSSIIKEALEGTVCQRNIAVIIEGAYYQNQGLNSPAKKPDRHFESESIDRSIKYVKSEHRKILNAACEAGPDQEMRTRALFHFGMMVHTLNNFYTNTNYLPNLVKAKKKEKDDSYDPYDLALADWSKISSSGKNAVKLIELRDRPTTFQKPIQDTTLTKVARGLAIREVRRQWDFIESMIRARYIDKADIIIAALKTAGCDKLVPNELEGLPLHAHSAVNES